MLSLNAVNVSYGRIQVLKEISFEVREGEIASVVGANGAGKSTLLNTISRILSIKSGTIHFFDKEISKYPPHRMVELGVVQVPERRRLFPSLTVLENLRLGAYLAQAKKKRKETLQEVFKLFPILEERREQLAGTLSGGEQQMLAIGRGLMSLSRLLMLDEPSLGLAPLVVQHMFEIVQKINLSGVTILLVEQNAKRALSLSHTGFVIENGRIVIQGKGEDLIHNEYTKKAFLGV
jgi:branched-chain amino acid transport system ATP-binding protein